MHAARGHDARNDRSSLSHALATPESKQRYVRRLFDTIADRYDLITILLSFGRDAAWKRRLVRMAANGGHLRALDLACGTGDITYALVTKGARVVGLDVTPRMIALAKEKRGSGAIFGTIAPENRTRPSFLVGDMMALPFPDASFDLITTGYGLRNVPELEPAIAEMARVLRPGGHLLSLDFNRPDNGFVRAAYLGYLHVVGGALGWTLHRDPDTYRYIAATIRRYPGATRVAALLQRHGFETAEWRPVLGGLMAIHQAQRRS